MFNAATLALSDLLSPAFRSVLLKALGLTLALFIALFIAVQLVFKFLALVPWPWLETLLAVGAGLGLLVAFFFLMAPVTAIFAGLFLDGVADKVEQRHYPKDKRGTPLPMAAAIGVALKFGLLVLAVNILALPMVFTGLGAIILLTINAYLISREYFEMVAMRFMAVDEAREFRKENALAVFAAGFLPALMAIVPILNLTVPLFSTSYFTHLFKRAQKSSG